VGTGKAGGSGIVVVKELNKATGVWSMQSQFQNQGAGTWPDGTVSVGNFNADFLVVAGGGGGGQRGGGGAGGYRLFACQPFTAWTTYPVTVGGGGGGSAKGEDSVFKGNTSAGGGYGGAFSSSSPVKDGGPGGSGGGGGGNLIASIGAGGPGNDPATSPVAQGYDGAPGLTDQGSFTFGGGGGGAAAVGLGGPSTCISSPNAGGAGTSSIPTFGAAPQPYYPVPGPGEGYFSGGGGGFQDAAGGSGGLGGIGGGGTNITCGTVTTAVANSGGGGAGGQSGGSGIVLIKIPAAAAPGVSLTPGCNTLVAHPDGSTVAHIIKTGTVVVE
jgi:hypothetical protein